jgi:tRNA (guanine37-N1)-methyltransferase
LTIYLSPQGRKFDQQGALDLVKNESIIFLAGRYEGVDERLIKREIDEEWSIGDYILTGGELAAMVMIDTMARFLPEVVGDQESVRQDSLSAGLLKYDQYTRPMQFDDENVPDVLLSGHHKQIETWRLKASLGKTWLRRPDLLEKRGLNKREIGLLCEFIKEFFQEKQ